MLENKKPLTPSNKPTRQNNAPEQALLQTGSCLRGQEPARGSGGTADTCARPSQGCALDSGEGPCDLAPWAPSLALFVPREDHAPALRVVPSRVPSPCLQHPGRRIPSFLPSSTGHRCPEGRPWRRPPVPWAAVSLPQDRVCATPLAAVLRSLPHPAACGSRPSLCTAACEVQVDKCRLRE